MRRWALADRADRTRVMWASAVALLSGCTAGLPVPAATLFAPRSMRIHPIFTQEADLDGSGRPDGISAQLEFVDQFGDPTKATGQALFELFEYRREPPYTGRRVGGPWVASLASVPDQRDKWNQTLRTYRFPLAFPPLNPAQQYVLSATFELTGGGRFFQKLVLAGHPPTDRATRPSGGLGL